MLVVVVAGQPGRHSFDDYSVSEESIDRISKGNLPVHPPVPVRAELQSDQEFDPRAGCRSS